MRIARAGSPGVSADTSAAPENQAPYMVAKIIYGSMVLLLGLTLNELSDSLSQWLFLCVRRGVSRPLSERSRLCRGKGNHSCSPRSFGSRLHNTGVSQIQKLSSLQGVRGYRCTAQS